MPSRRAVRMIRQAISPRLAMSREAITGNPRQDDKWPCRPAGSPGWRERARESASRPPIASSGPGPAATGHGQRSGSAAAVARLVADRAAGAADGHAKAPAGSASALRQSAEFLVADPAHG